MNTQGQSDNRERLSGRASLDWKDHGCIRLFLTCNLPTSFIHPLFLCHPVTCPNILKFKNLFWDIQQYHMYIYFNHTIKAALINMFILYSINLWKGPLVVRGLLLYYSHFIEDTSLLVRTNTELQESEILHMFSQKTRNTTPSGY